MARLFLDTLKQNIATNIPDNAVGAVTPAIIRSIMTDIIDSTTNDEVEMWTSATVGPIALTGTYQDLLVFDTVEGGDAFLIPNAPAGSITTGPSAGFSYRVIAQIQYTAGNNEQVEFVMAAGGIPFSFVSGYTTPNNGAQVTALVDVFANSVPANTVVTLQAKALDGTATINVLQSSFLMAILPTNNP